ncbi:hypothetical protein ACJZ2D_007126 [Fusarium nematophilum]
MASQIQILLVGATGYVGGTVLSHIIQSKAPELENLTIDLLVRSQDAAAKLVEAYGDRVNPILWQGLEDTSFIVDVAKNYDIIINTGFGFAPDGAEAFVRGLARRIPDSPVPWFIHLSGCSNLADRPITQSAQRRDWDDADGEAVYEFLKTEDARDPYPQRTAEVAVLSAGEETGVRAVSVNSPCIFGTGTGLFRREGFIIPAFLRYVLKHGYAFKLNETASFDWVHVEDLADLFVRLVLAIITREDRGDGYIPSGKSGIISSTVGSTLQTEMMQLCLDAAFESGALPREDTPSHKEIRQVTLQEIADEIMNGLVDMAERSWAGHKRLKGTVARKLLGWNPTRLDEAWRLNYIDEMNALKSGNAGGMLEQWYN